jgi:hypothetical protein
VGQGFYCRECQRSKLESLDGGTISLPDVFVLSLESSVCCGGTRAKVYGRVEGIRLHDRFRIALEESVALVSRGYLQMRGRLLQDKEKLVASPMLNRLCVWS